MAILVQSVFKSLPVQSGYIELVEVRFDKRRDAIVVQAVLWATSDKSDALEIKVYEFPYAILEVNPHVWAYNQLKTLPEFAGAIDV